MLLGELIGSINATDKKIITDVKLCGYSRITVSPLASKTGELSRRKISIR